MKQFFSFLPKLLKSKGLFDEAKASLILEKTKQVLENNFSEDVVSFCTPKKYINTVVYLQCANSGWRNEIEGKKHIILALIKAELPHENISEIICI